MADYRSNRGNNNYNNNHGVLSEICPEWLASYISQHLNSMTKIINHILIMTLVCDVMLWFHSLNRLPKAEKVSMGYNIGLISFILITQTLIVWIILNNTNNRFGITLVPMCTPNDFMVGVCLGLCIGGTVVAYIMSRSFETASHQCTAFDKITNYTHPRLLLETNTTTTDGINTTSTTATIVTIPSTSTSTTSTSSFHHNDPILEYICSLVFQRILRSRLFWSSWVYRFNFTNCFLIAVARTELTGVGIQQQHQQHSYSGVSTFDENSNISQTNSMQGPGTGSYNNNTGPSTNFLNPNTVRMPTFVGDYATIPEVRTPSSSSATTIPIPVSNSNGSRAGSSSTSKKGSGSGEAASILSV